MNGWELEDPVGLLKAGDGDAIREFCGRFQMAATNPEATALVLVRKYDSSGQGAPGSVEGEALGLGKGFRAGLCVFTSEGEAVFQLPTLRTYLSLAIVGDPREGADKIVIETDLGEALTSLAELSQKVPSMADTDAGEDALETAFMSLE
ncbi:MAG: hypothetical protein AAGG01_18100 [Planctomycetota bacterium]